MLKSALQHAEQPMLLCVAFDMKPTRKLRSGFYWLLLLLLRGIQTCEH